MSDDIPTHPVQNSYDASRRGRQSRVPQLVTMRAYEVYCHVHGEREALVTGGCRGGFSVGELIAFLYARSFPKAEWSTRADEAMGDLGRAVAMYIGGIMLLCGAGGIIVGVVLAYAVPWLFRHVSIVFN